MAAQLRRIELTVPRVLEGSSGTPTCDNTPAADGILERSTGRVYKPNSTSTSNYCILCIIEHTGMWFWIPSNFCVFGLRESGFSGPKLYYATSVAWLSLRPLKPGQFLGFMGGVQEHLYFVYYAPSLIAWECNLHSRQDLLVCSAPLLQLR